MSRDPTRLEVYCHDVGQGDCTVVLPPDGEGAPILFDCADPYVAERFFDNHGITRLAAVVVSHLDVDHIRGILPFLKQHFAKGGQVDRLVLGLDRREPLDAATDLLDQALAWAESPPHQGFQLVPPHRVGGPLRLASGSGWKVDLVLPFYNTALGAQVDGNAANLASVVLRIERAGASVLVGGDAPLGSWEHLEAGLRDANVIRVPHHGGEIREAGSHWTDFDDLYDAVKAGTSVVSVGTCNPHGHPLPEHLSAMRRGAQCRVLCTQMTEQCHRKLTGVRGDALTLASSLETAYRHRAVPGHSSRRPAEEVPCAGTVLISIHANGTIYVSPKRSLHGDLIDNLDHPMCLA
jgi:beta-lactamase superfamily II metal-dependent hydrolase